MTTDQPTAQRILRRRTDDRVIGGVASGVGDFLNVDPLLIRIGFVGLMVFGGLGLLLYVGGWLLIPEDTGDDSIVEQLLDRAGLTTRRFLLGLLLLIGGFMFVAGVNDGLGTGFATALGAAIVVIILGAVMLRWGERPQAAGGAPVATPSRSTDPGSSAVAAPAVARRRAARPRRTPSPLGWYVLGAMLAAIGLLALAINISGGDVDLGQFFGLALGVIGIGLVIGTWWGHARLLIVLGVLLLPFAITASFITVPIEGGLGYHRFRPANVEELRDSYRLVGGSVVLDLTEIQGGDEPIVIAASVAVGEVFVALPEDAGFELDASVGAGTMVLLGDWKEGTSIQDRYVREGTGLQFILDLEAGIGTVYVENCCGAVNH
jgi:phage shock protein PspC (stress-responsive transcriptional regulator)